jgi:hypothetical protein
MSHNKSFDTPNRVKFFKHILIGTFWSFFQILKSLLSFKSTIVNQRVPHHWVRFLHLPMQIVKNKINSPPPDNPGEITFQENYILLKDSSSLQRGRSKRHCIMEKYFQPFLAKNCHNVMILAA